ncbi:MAG: hypothetical protein NWQ27_04990 [Crocinitomicaceae bacterium]|nr:hypothetical protein [Crocinitomicaceae bacterium]
MKNITKNILVASSFVLVASFSFGQSSNDAARIAMTAYVPQQIENMPSSARSMLANKLGQVVTQNGIGGGSLNPRFIIAPNITVLTKDLTTTAPPMTALTLEVTMYIGDGIDGTLFETESITVKGVGTNETKAYISALKMIKPEHPDLKAFMERGKQKIIDYYTAKCDFIIKEAQTLEAQNKFEEAIYTLITVPEVCKECYDKCMDAVAPIYKKQIDRECKIKLGEAQTTWNAAQDMAAAETAGAILATIAPEASCFGEVKSLNDKIAAKVKLIGEREYKFQLKEQAQVSERIQAVRDIGVAYGKGQPKTVVYNTRGWY